MDSFYISEELNVDSLLFVVAMLCHVNVHVTKVIEVAMVEKSQYLCQTYYANCLQEAPILNDHALLECMIKR